MKIGVVKKDPSIKKNRDGSKNVVILQCEIEDPEDIQEVEFMFQPGQTLIPQKEDKILIIPISDSWLIGISSNDNIVPTGNPGDRKFYSTYKKDDDSSTIMQAILSLLATGEITIQAADGADPATLLAKIDIPNDGSMSIKSTDSGGTDQAKIDLTNSGDLELNGNADFAVAFNDLKIEFNELKTVVNTHTHLYSPGPSPQVATATALPQSTANIDNTKIDTVKFP